MERPQRTDYDCPACGWNGTGVVLTVNAMDESGKLWVVRRRRCLKCRERWYTKQPTEERLTQQRLKWTNQVAHLIHAPS